MCSKGEEKYTAKETMENMINVTERIKNKETDKYQRGN